MTDHTFQHAADPIAARGAAVDTQMTIMVLALTLLLVLVATLVVYAVPNRPWPVSSAAPVRVDSAVGGQFTAQPIVLPAELPATPLPAEEALTPHMQAALDYTARRYRVSATALQPVFAAAQITAGELGLDPLLIIAVIGIESSFNPLSESTQGAQGLMQVIPRFHRNKFPAGADGMHLFDPVANVRVGARALQEYIRDLGGLTDGLQQFAGSRDDVTQSYAEKVLAERERLELAARRQTGTTSSTSAGLYAANPLRKPPRIEG
ncbi:MAG: transglycosylase SLT domain-containing protein [Rhodocyclaceae bacterium]|nr:transglycosylase SLT domain-containing protein [Rhodocyclaceae bacterium]MDZ4213613.1 transglycosylase SLT domain-containing protein [Rhodocyclaceae bacterium]